MSSKINYFFDTEFIEGKQAKTCLDIKVGETKPTIDLISIGMVCEDGREYYAVSKDFNLKEAWNRFDLKPDIENGGTKKVYWIRENVLRPIWIEECKKGFTFKNSPMTPKGIESLFTYKNFKKLIDALGKSNKEIANEIYRFVFKTDVLAAVLNQVSPVFYAYYADYDWVVFCWLFGKMNELPKGFPYYCRDLKQIADDIWETTGKDTRFDAPKNEHNALADAKWNFEFYKFLMTKKND